MLRNRFWFKIFQKVSFFKIDTENNITTPTPLVNYNNPSSTDVGYKLTNKVKLVVANQKLSEKITIRIMEASAEASRVFLIGEAILIRTFAAAEIRAVTKVTHFTLKIRVLSDWFK